MPRDEPRPMIFPILVCLLGPLPGLLPGPVGMSVAASLSWPDAQRPLAVIKVSEDRPQSAEQRAILDQKLLLLSNYLKSPALTRLSAVGDDEAGALLRSAEKLRDSAQALLAADDLDAGAAALDEALKLVSTAKLLVKNADGGFDPVHTKTAFERMHREIEGYLHSLRQTIKGDIDQDDVLVSLKQVESLAADARIMMNKGSDRAAMERLTEAYQFAVQLVVRVRDGQTVAYRLSFATAEEELAYERERNASYLALIELVLREDESLTSGRRALIERLVEESASSKRHADQEAARGAPVTAIEAMEASTGSLLRALQVSGLPVME